MSKTSEVCTRLTVVRMTSMTSATRTLDGHLTNTQMFPGQVVANACVCFLFNTYFQFAFSSCLAIAFEVKSNETSYQLNSKCNCLLQNYII